MTTCKHPELRPNRNPSCEDAEIEEGVAEAQAITRAFESIMDDEDDDAEQVASTSA